MTCELEEYQSSIKEFNDRTRLGFEDFIQKQGTDRNKLQLRCTPFTDKKCGYGSFDLDFGLSVYRYQQSKVDDLQKRVDAAQKIADKMVKGTVSVAMFAYELEQALKGGAE